MNLNAVVCHNLQRVCVFFFDFSLAIKSFARKKFRMVQHLLVRLQQRKQRDIFCVQDVMFSLLHIHGGRKKNYTKVTATYFLNYVFAYVIGNRT